MSQEQQITLSISSLSALAVVALFLACVHKDSTKSTSSAAEPPPEATLSKKVESESKKDEPEKSEPEVEVAVEPIEPMREPEFTRITTPLFAESPEKVVISKTTWALAAPKADGDRLGLVSGNAKIRILSHVINDECATPWIEVAPRGFICVPVKPVPASKKKRARKRKAKKRALIGSYAIAAKGARFYKNLNAAKTGGRSRPARGDMLRRSTVVTLEDGRKFWKTQRGEFIEASSVRRLWGSKFKGVEIDADAPPVAFAVHRRGVGGRVVVRRQPSDRARAVKKLKPRQVVSVLEISEDKSFARIASDQWVARVDLREVITQAPPEGVEPDGVLNRWADIDLDKQLVVLYEGVRPVFATLASTGRKKDRTPTGQFRVTRKKRRTTMASDRSRRQTYSAAVPWSTYFYEGIAFHTAYWHNSFGKARSHGCVNLSPTDARTVYDFLGPELPEGWSVVYGHDTQKGSVVQVRSAIPNPVPATVVASN